MKGPIVIDGVTYRRLETDGEFLRAARLRELLDEERARRGIQADPGLVGLLEASADRPQPCHHCGAAYTPHTDDCPVSPRAPGPMQPRATPAPPPAAPAPVIAPPPPAPSPWPPGWAGTAPRPTSTGGFTSGGPSYYGASGPPSPARPYAPGFNSSRPFDRRAVGEAVVDLLTALTKDGSIPGFATTDQFDELVSDIIETIRSGT